MSEARALLKQGKLMDSQTLARRCRALRAEKGLTQEEVANQIISERTGRPISKQLISRAENEDVDTRVDNLRIRIIELLSGNKVVGPFWFIEEEEAA